LRHIGKYEVLGELTPGGMAQLFLCCTQGPGGFRKLVVVKRIAADSSQDDNFVNMFLDEARITAAFSNPSITQVFDLGEDGDGFYVAMEFIAGQNLNEVVQACATQSAVLPVGFSVSVIHDCALALHYAHTFKTVSGEDNPVVHRDVAQKNIMVTYDGQVKLLDFGIAKAKNALSKTRAGMVKGTAGYMSPEQVRGEALDGRSDVFALGVVFWEMVTGRRLFSAGTEIEELRLILDSKIERPSTVEPTVPDALSDIVMKALQRDKNARFASARELSKAISLRVPHLLFDAEERANFMRERFADKILATRKLVESNDEEIGQAIEAFQRESSNSFPAQQKPKHSLKKMAPVADVSTPKGRSFSSPNLSVSRLPKVQETAPTEAQVGTFSSEDGVKPRNPGKGRFTQMAEAEQAKSSSYVPYIVVVCVALLGGLFFYKVMLKDSLKASTEVPVNLNPTPIEVTPAPQIQKNDSINNPSPFAQIVDPPNTKETKEPIADVKKVLPKGDVVLYLIPEATVYEGNKLLGTTVSSRLQLSLTVKVHQLTVIGKDGVKHPLTLPVTAKKQTIKYQVKDLP
jgi:eukaryotic-like serine/threonine-protein kinase